MLTSVIPWGTGLPTNCRILHCRLRLRLTCALFFRWLRVPQIGSWHARIPVVLCVHFWCGVPRCRMCGALIWFKSGYIMKKFSVPLFVLVLLMAPHAGASVVTSIPGGTVITMPAMNFSGGGPITFGPGVTWSSTNVGNGSDSKFGFTAMYGFGFNGQWTGTLGPMAGLNDSTDFFGVTDTMTFAFATPVGSVGGFLNYYPGSTNPTTIAVYDSSHTLLESYALTFLTTGGNDTGAFYGFQETTKNISYFTLTDNYIGITKLTVGGPAAIPEPGSLILLGSGLLGAISYGRRRLGR